MTKEALLSLSSMDSCHGIGYHLLTKHGFIWNGCDEQEQGIQVSLGNGGHEHSYGLGFNPFKQP